MKAVLMSIQPKWCELIASGKKTVEVRKTKPKLDVPFKVYIYCTKDNTDLVPSRIWWKADKTGFQHILNGMVIGEFVCDKIDEYPFCPYICEDGTEAPDLSGYAIPTVEGEKTGMDYGEAEIYGNGKPLYFWHISNLVIYDKPRELGEFYHYCGDNPKCEGCEAHYYSNTECGKEDYCCSPIEGCKPITRPLQSWGYVYEAY